jgi:ElaB/YqjD/DUF883 family membrane-anchored ribosome-binding protein
MNSAQSPSKSSGSHDDLKEQIESLRKDLSELAATVTDDVSDGIEDAGRKIRKSGKDATKMASKAVRGNPLSAVAIAAGFGLIVGLLLHKS